MSVCYHCCIRYVLECAANAEDEKFTRMQTGRSWIHSLQGMSVSLYTSLFSLEQGSVTLTLPWRTLPATLWGQGCSDTVIAVLVDRVTLNTRWRSGNVFIYSNPLLCHEGEQFGSFCQKKLESLKQEHHRRQRLHRAGSTSCRIPSPNLQSVYHRY